LVDIVILNKKLNLILWKKQVKWINWLHIWLIQSSVKSQRFDLFSHSSIREITLSQIDLFFKFRSKKKKSMEICLNIWQLSLTFSVFYSGA
jgi:hypothetical protein